jgi:hypothetical protein
LKRIPPTTLLRENVHGARVFLDDLEHVVQTMSAAGLSVRIEAHGYEWESFEELARARGTRISRMGIIGAPPNAEWPRTSVTVWDDMVTLNVDDTSALGAAAFQLRDQIRGLKSPSLRRSSSFRFWIAGTVCSLVALLASWEWRSPTIWYIGFGVGILLYMLGAAAPLLHPRLLGTTLRRRHEGGTPSSRSSARFSA